MIDDQDFYLISPRLDSQPQVFSNARDNCREVVASRINRYFDIKPVRNLSHINNWPVSLVVQKVGKLLHRKPAELDEVGTAFWPAIRRGRFKFWPAGQWDKRIKGKGTLFSVEL